MGRKFTCEICHQSHESDDDWTHEKQLEEAMDNGFGADLVKGDYAIVCDACYHRFMTLHGLRKEKQ